MSEIIAGGKSEEWHNLRLFISGDVTDSANGIIMSMEEMDATLTEAKEVRWVVAMHPKIWQCFVHATVGIRKPPRVYKSLLIKPQKLSHRMATVPRRKPRKLRGYPRWKRRK